MATSKSIFTKDTTTEEELEFFVGANCVFIQNRAEDATHFCASVNKKDWEEIKKFIDEQLNQNPHP